MKIERVKEIIATQLSARIGELIELDLEQRAGHAKKFPLGTDYFDSSEDRFKAYAKKSKIQILLEGMTREEVEIIAALMWFGRAHSTALPPVDFQDALIDANKKYDHSTVAYLSGMPFNAYLPAGLSQLGLE